MESLAKKYTDLLKTERGSGFVMRIIKKAFDLDFNKDKFIFTRVVGLTEGEENTELRFGMIEGGEIYKIPYLKRFDYQKFLNSGNKKDLPK